MDSIIFDVDGTLWDSTAICAQSWNTVIRRETDLDPVITEQTLKGLFGRLLPDIAKVIFPDYSKERQLDLIDQCCQEEHRALLACCAPLYPDLEETLARLSEKYRLFIVSNCQAGYIEVFLTSSGLGRYFEGHLCPGDTGNPKGENILQIIRDFHLESPVYVGDTDGDRQASKTAGIPFVFASYGFGTVSSYDYTIKSPKELLNFF
ncbi:MAG: HAD family hydrolase [Clostridiales bacterium]|nr:HAD family hydrolase [Clostridiales bacterium]